MYVNAHDCIWHKDINKFDSMLSTFVILWFIFWTKMTLNKTFCGKSLDLNYQSKYHANNKIEWIMLFLKKKDIERMKWSLCSILILNKEIGLY